MEAFKKHKSVAAHTITSQNMLICPDTERVVAVFYNDYDIDEVLGENTMTDGHASPVKIIQMVVSTKDMKYQGAFLGLGDDGVVYVANGDGKWEVYQALEFKINQESIK